MGQKLAAIGELNSFWLTKSTSFHTCVWNRWVYIVPLACEDERVDACNILIFIVTALDELLNCRRYMQNNGVARTLKSYAHQRKTTGPSSDSIQLNMNFLLKKRISSQREQILSFKRSSLWY